MEEAPGLAGARDRTDVSLSMKTSPQDRQLGTRAECLVSLGTVSGYTDNHKSGLVEPRGIGTPDLGGLTENTSDLEE